MNDQQKFEIEVLVAYWDAMQQFGDSMAGDYVLFRKQSEAAKFINRNREQLTAAMQWLES